MKQLAIGIALGAILITFPYSAIFAQGTTGGCFAPPAAPPNCYYVCICSPTGDNCNQMLVCRQ